MNKQKNNKNRLLRAMFDALSDERRFIIFKLLMRKKDLCVSDIAETCTISVPAASQQLKILERSHIVRRQKTGRRVCYVLDKTNRHVLALQKMVR